MPGNVAKTPFFDLGPESLQERSDHQPLGVLLRHGMDEKPTLLQLGLHAREVVEPFEIAEVSVHS
jgi:hypothetical protein